MTDFARLRPHQLQAAIAANTPVVLPIGVMGIAGYVAIMAALLVHDLRNPESSANPDVPIAHPMQLFVDRACHGGLWRSPYSARSVLGFAAERPLPAYADERFDRWFRRRVTTPAGARGRVILWDDTFVRYHEPHIGQAAVKVLEAAGYRVELLANRRCCGRPAFSQGNLDAVARWGRHNLALLDRETEDVAVEVHRSIEIGDAETGVVRALDDGHEQGLLPRPSGSRHHT